MFEWMRSITPERLAELLGAFADLPDDVQAAYWEYRQALGTGITPWICPEAMARGLLHRKNSTKQLLLAGYYSKWS